MTIKREIQNGSRCSHCGVHIIAFYELSKMCHKVCQIYKKDTKQHKMARTFLSKHGGGAIFRFECDHMDAYGLDSRKNLQTLCQVCNWQKTSGNDNVAKSVAPSFMRKRLKALAECLPDKPEFMEPIYKFVSSMEEWNG